ncbi:MAG: hypothetical protein IPQ07_34335 [Myxococcales bacterium]|nr:hypothetical protein [Myxococcales bacterium]
MITLQPGQRADLDVPVVGLSEEPGVTLGGFGADFDPSVLVPPRARTVDRSRRHRWVPEW